MPKSTKVRSAKGVFSFITALSLLAVREASSQSIMEINRIYRMAPTETFDFTLDVSNQAVGYVCQFQQEDDRNQF